MKYQFSIGPGSQGDFVTIDAERCDTYPNGVKLDIGTGDWEGTCDIYCPSEQVREIGQRLIEIADAIDAEYAALGQDENQ